MPSLEQHPFLLACRREPTTRTPIWLMRQAGRYLPEYRSIRQKISFLDLCTNSDLAAEVTVDAVRRLGVDAAIVFADLLLPLLPMGIELHYDEGGPRITPAIRDAARIAALRADRTSDLQFVGETIRLVRAALPQTPVIGFAGAPFTLASYMIEGGSSGSFTRTKRFLHDEPRLWQQLMTVLVSVTIEYLRLQVAAGAHALQLFDTWAGSLSPEDYRRFALPYARDVVAALHGSVPIIYFSTMTGGMLELVKETAADVIAVDWRVRLDDAWSRLGPDVAIQGNLDPALLLASKEELCDAARLLLRSVRGKAGHVFNLGHGVLPQTPVDNVLALVETVREFHA